VYKSVTHKAFFSERVKHPEAFAKRNYAIIFDRSQNNKGGLGAYLKKN
jgi:hypothetical protein